VPESETTLRTCEKCGGPIEQKRMGRPRKYCAMCTPRSAEDKAAAREYWAARDSEEQRRRSEALRAQIRMLRDREAQRVCR
jgi:reverse gyrase